jgi:hypothetical protein
LSHNRTTTSGDRRLANFGRFTPPIYSYTAYLGPLLGASAPVFWRVSARFVRQLRQNLFSPFFGNFAATPKQH